MRPILTRLLAAVVLAAAVSSLSWPAVAQAEYSKAKLEAFVVAGKAVSEIIRNWSARIEGAGSEAEAATLRDEGHARLVAAIEDTEGITVDEYLEINEAARTDAGLLARIREIAGAPSGN